MYRLTTSHYATHAHESIRRVQTRSGVLVTLQDKPSTPSTPSVSVLFLVVLESEQVVTREVAKWQY
jgi:hypothetical protein